MKGDASLEIFQEIVTLKKEGKEGVLVTVVQKEGSGPAEPGARMLIYADGRHLGTVGGGSIEQIALKEVNNVLRQKKSCLKSYSLTDEDHVVGLEHTGMMCGGTAMLFYEYIPPSKRLYIFGGGHVGRALAYHLRHSPWHVTVVDNRTDVIANIVGADQLLEGHFEEALSKEPVPEGSYFVVATHSHQMDYQVVLHILQSDVKPAYIGLIASKKKSETIVKKLMDTLGKPTVFEHLYTPVGLDLGGGTPDEIAVSIVAEIQALSHGKSDHKHLKKEWGMSEC